MNNSSRLKIRIKAIRFKVRAATYIDKDHNLTYPTGHSEKCHTAL